MTILLQWLVEHAWIFYAACAAGIVIYVARALTARRERNLALFTLERETATAQIAKSWVMVFVFVAIGAVIFLGATFVIPSISVYSPGTPFPTSTPSAGLEPPPPGLTPTLSPALGSLSPAFTPTTTAAPVSTFPPPEPTGVPTLAPTDTPEPVLSGEVRVRFGDFAELTSYSLPAVEVTAAQPLPLTLYWRGLEGTSPMDYIVFTHLLSGDGQLIAQHDGAPASGTRPVTGWASGETITDLHPMIFQDTTYTGPARIAVGLYDPTIGRVLTQTGDDYVILPVTIIIVSQ